MLIKNRIILDSGRLPVQMARSDATAFPLLITGKLGADLIRFPPGGEVPLHTHPGSHLLFVVSGEGFVECDGEKTPIQAGDCYAIPGGSIHAIQAGPTSELTMIAVGDDHRDAGSEGRLDVTAQ